MEFSASSGLILKALSRVIGVVNKTAISEYLSCVKISVSDQFMVEATNMDVVVSSWFNLESVTKKGAICVDAYSLFEIIKKLPKENQIKFSLESNGDSLQYLTIQSGKSKFDIATLNPENYPETLVTIKNQTILIPRDDLLFLVDKAKTCIYSNETRYNINGMLLNFSKDSDKIFGIATDGHRLAYSFVNNPSISESQKATIPRKIVIELKKVLDSEEGDITIDVSSSKLTFNFSQSRLTTKLIDAEFPDYERVIPKDYTHYFSVNTKNFLNAIDRVSSIYSTGTSEIGVRLNISSTAVKITSTKDINRSFDELPATFTKEEEMQIMCNFLYIKEILTLINAQEVNIFIKDSNSPIIIKDSENPNFFYVIMPMKI
jgi:DNA polymerase-3 subunit beta